MAASRYYVSRRARDDLESISNYLAERSPSAARRVLTELHNTFQLLARNPEIGTLRNDLHPDVRLFTPSRPARNYIVFFYPHRNGVEISDIIHAAQNWEDMFARGAR